MKHYELTYLTRQDMTEDDAKKLQETLAASIQAKNGTVTELQKAYKKKLAYPVEKQEAAYVNAITFQLEAKDLETLKKEVEKMAQIIRSLIVTYTPYTPRPMAPRPETVEETKETVEPAAVAAEKPAAETPKPKLRREKPKADLKEIGEKLDEILNQ